MYTVTVRGPDGAEATYPLGQDQGLVVGRDETCDIVLPSKRVSRRHARFFTNGERLHVEDLGSQNGVFVGGARLAGTSEVRPGPAIEVGEFKIRIKKADPRAVVAATGVDVNVAAEGRLKGLGDEAGQALALPRERGFVGRDPERELCIDNDSVSRKHAEVRLEAGTVHVVVDLASSNGTFVNGERLKPNLPSRLKHGDKVRFGETHWQYLVGSEDAPAATGLTARHKQLVAVGAVLVVFLAGAMLLKHPAPPPTGTGRQGQQGRGLADVLAQGQQAMTEDRFADAKRAFQKVNDADPLNEQARLLLRQANSELANQRLFTQASTKADVGRDAEALGLLFQIDTGSRVFAQARLKVQELAAELMKRDLARCRDAGRRRQRQDALQACARYLDYECHTGVDKQALKLLREAEKATHARTAWQCPAQLAAWFGSGTPAPVDPSEIIARRYQDKDVRAAVLAYVQGDLDQAQNLIEKAKGKEKGHVADDLDEALTIIAGRYKEGDAAARAGDVRTMQQAFDQALAEDAKVVPDGLTSFQGRDMRSRLAKALYAQGSALFSQQSYTDAYDAWAKGLGYDGTSSALLDGMTRLEKKAEELLDASPGCPDLRVALHITPATSSVHARANQLFSRKCGG